MTHKGIVHIVGAGPGDPELLTIRALRLLQSADVIVYDRLVGDDILGLADPAARKIFVGKRKSHHAVPQAGINALLVPLYDPLRLAEDVAVLDNLSAGRFSFVAGMGYRPAEYHAVSRDWSRRGALMDECLTVMLKAWGDEPFSHKGELVNVTPKPRTRPHPFFFIGGMSAPAAKRAARFGLPFSPPAAMPDVEAVYNDELKRLGATGFIYRPANGSTITLLHHDPDVAWKTYGPFIMNEFAEYSGWKRPGVPRPNETTANSVEHLRSLNSVEILTPQQLVDQILAGRREVVINPLVGGLPLEEGWASLRLLADEVLPRARRRRDTGKK